MPSLFDTFVVLKPDLLLDTRRFGTDFYERLAQDYAGFAGHVLVSAHEFTADWGVWEKHPAGDEMVVLLSGRAEMRLRRDGEESAVTLSEPGAYVVVPRGAWHTAMIAEPTRMLFVTAGEGTEHSDQPGPG